MMFLPPEWHRQAFVQLTWPNENTDWAPVLGDAIDCFCNMAREIAKREPLVIVAHNAAEVEYHLRQANKIDTKNICIIGNIPNNDTWARDHAFITCIDNEEHSVVLNDYQFNGWGLKFPADKDNLINTTIRDNIRLIYLQHHKAERVEYRNQLDFVLEGGSIESDGEGTLLVTTSCLLSSNRNNAMNQQDIELRLKNNFNISRVLWLHHSWLDGDDTDGHIDTVARFCNTDTIAYVACDNTKDPHYDKLQAMRSELESFRTADGKPYKLIALPLPDPCHDSDNLRLPATYANFLIINGAVLVPTYNQPQNDRTAMENIQKAFPDREIVGIDCRVLILQHGSLHCSTMQYPTI